MVVSQTQVRCGVHADGTLLQSNVSLLLVLGYHVYYTEHRHIMAALAHHSQLWEQEHMSQQRVPTSHEPVTGVLTFL